MAVAIVSREATLGPGLLERRLDLRLGKIIVEAGMIRKRWRGLKLGLIVGRSSGFVAPKYIRIRGRKQTLRLPPERGISVTFAEILLADVYGLDRLRHVRRVLDVGANVGLFAVAVHLRFPDAITHSYEPNEALAMDLTTNTTWTNAVVYHEAVGATAGTASLIEGGESQYTRINRTDPGPVQVTSLQSALDRLGGYADLVKLDCEGCEWELLDLAEPWPYIDNVSMEYHGDGQRAVERLQLLGYRIQSADVGRPCGVILASRRSAGKGGVLPRFRSTAWQGGEAELRQ